MKKFTPEEKAANKAAQKVRDRAFAERRRLYRAALETAERSMQESKFADAVNAARELVDVEWRNRNDACVTIEREILALQEKLERTKAQFEDSLQPKRKARSDAQQAFRDHRDATIADVTERFLDVSNCWSVSQWAIPEDVRAEMDAAAKAAVQP